MVKKSRKRKRGKKGRDPQSEGWRETLKVWPLVSDYPFIEDAQKRAELVAACPPPPWWTDAMKADWPKLPECVRHSVIEMEASASHQLSELANYKDLAGYREAALQRGLSLTQMVQAFTTVEAAMRKDPEEGLMLLVANLGFSEEEAGTLFADLGHALSRPERNNGHGMNGMH